MSKKKAPKIEVQKDGPYFVSGNVPLAEERMIIGRGGEPERWEKGRAYPDQKCYCLCRCGASKKKPFCDGTHADIAFDGTETAKRDDYLKNVERTPGPGVDLTWSQEYCAVARFCHGQPDAWECAERSADPAAKASAIAAACACPSGSLVAWDKETGKAIEPSCEPSIALVENPAAGTSGPIWVKGGIPVVAADGFEYEIRNRVTLCRCGASKNKPFCDGEHVGIGFKSDK
ncbi:MAG TPA: CDGSH iron-sulfur domain-containing protein [Acidobacteriota bacterium]|nr:CDGSH iron-sulfur domain-containing protein [Acidobacteriota bacterium]